MRTSSRSGFALFIAVTLLGLVAVTLVILATLVAADARKTRSAVTEAQLRQLLLAGEAIAQTRLSSGATVQGDVELPAELKTSGAKLTITGDAPKTRIEAQCAGKPAVQEIAFIKSGDAWTITSVQLDVP
ncbi:MAG TPA: hypothetical protein VF669_22740 [Tepidisphaeraceae bacterium]|jgi:hypothetical protein